MTHFLQAGSLLYWILWATVLLWQNYAFTMVSRARNSGSKWAHAKAAVQSNGVYFVQMFFATSSFMAIASGKYGVGKAVLAVFFYTFFTVAGSLYAHDRSLKKEAGLAMVGARKEFAQITTAEWNAARELLVHFHNEIKTDSYHVKIQVEGQIGTIFDSLRKDLWKAAKKVKAKL